MSGSKKSSSPDTAFTSSQFSPKEAERMLVQERDFISAILETIGALVFVLDPQGRFLRINTAFERMTGYTILELVGKPAWEVLAAPGEVTDIKRLLKKILKVDYPLEFQNEMRSKDGSSRSIVWSLTALALEGDQIEYIIASGIDISDSMQVKELLKRANQNLLESEKKKGEIIIQLKEALAEVKTLSGLLPICSHCKKIRDDRGYWNQIEEYIGGHSDAEFSHSLCPDCIQEHYSKYFHKVREKKK